MDDIDVRSQAAAQRIRSEAAEIDTEEKLQSLLRSARQVPISRSAKPSWLPTALILAAGFAVVAMVLGATAVFLDRDHGTPSPPVAPASSAPAESTPLSTAASTTAPAPTVEQSPPTNPPPVTLDVDMMLGWPSAPETPAVLDPVPYLLIADGALPGATSAERIESVPGESIAWVHYHQGFVVRDAAVYLTVVSRTIPLAFSGPSSPIEVPGWDEALARTNPVASTIQLADPSGWVDLTGFGMSLDDLRLVAESLDRRAAGLGWDLRSTPGVVTSDLVPVSAGWEAPPATRSVDWIGADGTSIAQLLLESGTQELIDADFYDSPAKLVEVSSTTALAQSGTRGSSISWHPAADVTATLSTRLSLDETLALAAAVRVVDVGTWSSATTPAATDPGGGCGFFGC